MRQGDPAHRSVGKALGVDQNALRRAAIFVDHEADDIAVVFFRCADARRERCLGGITPLFKPDFDRLASLEIVLDEAFEQEPAGLCQRRIDVTMLPPRELLVDHPKLDGAVVKALFLSRAVGEIEAPAVQPRLHAVLIEIGHQVTVRARIGERLGGRICLEIAVDDNLVTVLIGVEEVQHIGRCRLEPTDISGLAVARDQREARRDILVQANRVHVAGLEQFLVPEHRQVVEDRPVGTEDHVVRQPRPGQWHRDIVGQPAARIDDAVMHVRRVLRVVEEHQLAGRLVDLGMRRDPVERYPRRDAFAVERFGIDDIALAALIKGRDRLAAVHDDVGGGGILQPAVRAEPGALRHAGTVHQPTPQRTARDLFGFEAARANEAVAVGRNAVLEADLMKHAIAVERMMAAERLVDLIFSVSQIDAVDVVGNAALEDFKVEGVDLLDLRRPCARQIGVVARLERRSDWRKSVDAHSHDQLPR